MTEAEIWKALAELRDELAGCCPGCGFKLRPEDQLRVYQVGRRVIEGVYECPNCRAVLGSPNEQDQHLVVRNEMAPANVPAYRWLYYDLVTVTEAGKQRQHGWFDSVSRKIVQIG